MAMEADGSRSSFGYSPIGVGIQFRLNEEYFQSQIQ